MLTCAVFHFARVLPSVFLFGTPGRIDLRFPARLPGRLAVLFIMSGSVYLSDPTGFEMPGAVFAYSEGYDEPGHKIF